jgi:hypothetical protein
MATTTKRRPRRRSKTGEILDTAMQIQADKNRLVTQNIELRQALKKVLRRMAPHRLGFSEKQIKYFNRLADERPNSF